MFNLFNKREANRIADLLRQEALDKVRVIQEKAEAEKEEEYIGVPYATLLMGIGGCKLEGAPGSGHNYIAIIDAVHEYKKQNPNKNVEKYYYAGYMELCKRASTSTMIKHIYDYISYEIKKEVGNTKAFTIDTRNVLQEIKSVVERNQLQTADPSLGSWMDERDEFLESNYGHHL